MIAVYIGWIEISSRVEEKIGSKHGLAAQDVRDAVQWPAVPTRAAWLDVTSGDPRGPRLVVEGRTSLERSIRAVLYPVDDRDGTWRLGTAVPLV